MFRKALAALVGAGILMSSAPAFAQEFLVLGSMRADFKADRDEIEVRRGLGRFWGIKLDAEDGIIRLNKVIVRFGNGEQAEFKIDREIQPGQAAYIDFENDEGRRIDEIAPVHRTLGRAGKGQARLVVTGEKAMPQPPAADRDGLVRLGIKRVMGGRDTVTVEVGRREGRFTELRVRPRGGSLTVARANVTYSNGQTDTIRIREALNRGEFSDPIDLEGNARRIDKVTLAYRNFDYGRGASWLEVYGKEAPRRSARRNDYEEIGSLVVRSQSEVETLSIGRGDRRMEAIAMMAKGRPVRVERVTVTFGNGDRARFNIKRLLDPRDNALRLDFKGERRVREIRAEYSGRRQDRDQGRGELVFLADRSGPRREPDLRPVDNRPRNRVDWELIGTGKAALLSKDYDALQIGRDAGSFRAIRITARRSDVRMYGMRITYGNGTTEEVPVFGWIREGQTSQPFDLKGNRRRIAKIEFRYRTKLSLRGSGLIEVYGLR